MSKVLFCHDNADFAATRGEILRELFGHEVTVCTTARASLEMVSRGMNTFDAAIIHKDLGLSIEQIDSDQVVARIRESSPCVRVGIISGEFPDGKDHVIQALHADFYLEPNTDLNWCEQQLARGPVLPAEIARRGQSVEMPPI